MVGRLKRSRRPKGWFNHYRSRKVKVTVSGRLPQNEPMNEENFAEQIPSEAPKLGYLPSAPLIGAVDDEEMYKLDPETATTQELIDAKVRLGRLLKFKKLLALLPDGGEKVGLMYERVLTALDKLKLAASKGGMGFYVNANVMA